MSEPLRVFPPWSPETLIPGMLLCASSEFVRARPCSLMVTALALALASLSCFSRASFCASRSAMVLLVGSSGSFS